MAALSVRIQLIGYIVAVALAASKQFHPILLHRWGERDLVSHAPLIVLGTVRAVVPQGIKEPINWQEEPALTGAELFRVDLDVHHVIRGRLTERSIQAFYWRASEYTTAASLHVTHVGATSVHYLMQDGGVYRYVTDIVRSQTDVFSGNVGRGLNAGDPAEIQITSVLLTPGPDVNGGEFSANLGTSVSQSLELAGFLRTLPKLRELLNSHDVKIRAAACISLYEYSFFGQDSCMETKWIDEAPNRRFENVLAIRRKAIAAFTSGFLQDPVSTAEEYAALPGANGLRDFLGLMTRHPDKRIASRAAKELRGVTARSSERHKTH